MFDLDRYLIRVSYDVMNELNFFSICHFNEHTIIDCLKMVTIDIERTHERIMRVSLILVQYDD